MASLTTKQVDCLTLQDLQSLVAHIVQWQALPENKKTDLNNLDSGWTNTFYAGFLQTKPVACTWASARQGLTQPASTVVRAVPVLNMKETRDLLARVKFIYQGHLSRTCVAEFLPNGIVYHAEDSQSTLMTNELIKVANDGTLAILTRTFYWVLWRVKENAFEAIDRNNEASRQAF